MYLIQTQQFEGPLDLLLTMVEEKKLSISDVSLSRIADDYLSYVKKLEQFPSQEVAQFLVIASTLILIKSRSLLPYLEMEAEEEEDIRELEKRLAELRMFRQVSRHIAVLAKQPRRMYMRETFYGFEKGFYPSPGISTLTLCNMMKNIIASLPYIESLPEKILERAVSIEEKIKELHSRIIEKGEIWFDSMAVSKDKVERIVSFLALLELLKQGIIIAEQRGLFENISVKNAK